MTATLVPAFMSRRPAGGPSTVVAPPEPLDITPWLDGTNDHLAVGGILRVPDGYYRIAGAAPGDRLTVDRKASKLYIAAETAGGVVLDLNHGGIETALYFGDTAASGTVAYNLVLAGFDIRGGTVRGESLTDLSFFYCTMTRTRRDFYNAAKAAAQRLGAPYSTLTASDRQPFGDDGFHLYGPGTGGVGLTSQQWADVLAEMASPFGPARINSAKGQSQRVSFIGCDIPESFDDGVHAGAVRYLTIRGCRIWDVSEFEPQANGDAISVDPLHPCGGPENDLFHNDAAQLGASGNQWTIEHSVLGRIMWSAAPHPSVNGGKWDIKFTDNWFLAGTSVSGRGQGYGTGGALRITDDPKFANWPTRTDDNYPTIAGVNAAAPTASAPNWSGQIARNTYIARTGALVSFPVAAQSAFTRLTLTSNVVTVPNGIGDIFDEEAIVNHSSCPALVWRSSNPYSAMTTLS